MYIGVTGYTDQRQVRTALLIPPALMDRPCMIGVLASHKTIRGLPAGNPKRYPKREDIAGIFVSNLFALNLVHYNTSDQTELAAQLWSALKWGGPSCDGLQLNIVWPDPQVVRGLRRSAKHTNIVIQINRGAMQACENNPEQVAKRVCKDYGGTADYVLVDASGGRGIPLDPAEATAYLVALDHERLRSGAGFSLVVAGGLDADNLESLLAPIRLKVPEIGIDAEGGVRTDDVLDNDKVARYLRTAYASL